MRVAKIIFSIFFWVFFVVTAMCGFVVGASIHLLLDLTGIDRERRFMHWYINGWMFNYLRMNPWWKIEFVGKERLPKGGSVFVANHQSLADILVSFGLSTQYRFVSKAILFKTPLVGWSMKLCGYIPLVRGDGASARAMLDQCRYWIRKGIPVYIYPEGTFNKGDRLLPFRRGAFVLAMEENVPIVPIAISGTPGLVFEDSPLMSFTANVRVEILDPILPETFGDDPAALGARAREQISNALGLPIDDAPKPVKVAD
ncbi:MAG TPA: 1-acyl-sn-glycerol-3-phosphate acyltransferase [Polyangium sp.]|nr:1-acyl-sn-glycerol-3-phosphate acyltransferase [Polyangium sp.]